jgi:hypothetical protein
LGAIEAPKAVGVEVVRRALVGETKEGGGRECSGWLERNGKNCLPRVERKSRDTRNRGTGEMLKRPRS